VSCSVPAPVVFNYETWVATYPEFAYLSAPQGQNYFNIAQLYLANTPCGVVPNCSPAFALTMVLYMLTSHVAALLAPGPPTAGAPNGSPASPLVGRITNASEGSVSVAVDMPDQPASAAWYNQTKYGAMAWAALAPFRTMRYFPGARRYLGVGGYGYPSRGAYVPPFGFQDWGGS